MIKFLKLLLTILCFGIAIYGFMIKLPVPFRKIDTELHCLFFFFASAFLNILFKVKRLNNHLMIFGMLFLFSTLIEFAQEYSNQFFTKRIHGNFDKEDLKYNLLGLCCFSALWIIYQLILYIKQKIQIN